MATQVLVVEDNPELLEALTHMLEIYGGYEVFNLNNGAEVLSTIQRSRPDIILMDIMLGDSSGVSICNAIKSDEKTRDITVILISASSRNLLLKEMIHPPDDFIEKPFDMKAILEKIKSYVTE